MRISQVCEKPPSMTTKRIGTKVIDYELEGHETAVNCREKQDCPHCGLTGPQNSKMTFYDCSCGLCCACRHCMIEHLREAWRPFDRRKFTSGKPNRRGLRIGVITVREALR